MAIYFEARDQSFLGQLAVGQVIMSRVESPEFPNTPCDVVKQGRTIGGRPLRNQCHFSFWCDGKPEKADDENAAALAVMAAAITYFWMSPDITGNALYYHAKSVTPWWAREYEQTVTIQDHVFYREKGSE